ncbi:hypothetical protein EDWATA_02554 [Edwardsiella tarda ATCC 23685]|uniref:Uncharacterized protein n=1 Tax=Edwardsiella tarda ATCC 23685 TaxID=500638 RepID=D4F720_EDWTA|nr:hypothetical protein EDWATA_02554 [Edwardsiella tarda ATCC 23685]
MTHFFLLSQPLIALAFSRLVAERNRLVVSRRLRCAASFSRNRRRRG